MSGGSMNYVYSRVETAASDIRCNEHKTLLRLKFAELLDVIAQALHDIEWVDSSDYGLGDENEAIRRVYEIAKQTEITLGDETVIEGESDV
jgi:hypothetical protein